MNLSTFTLQHLREDPRRIFDLGDGVFDEMAAEAYRTTKTCKPDNYDTLEALFRDLVGVYATSKYLRDNIDSAYALLGPDSFTRYRDWVIQSGIQEPLGRSFDTGEPCPTYEGTLLLTGGAAGRQYEALSEARLFRRSYGWKVVVIVGNGSMEKDSHPQTLELAYDKGRVTETDFETERIIPDLRRLFGEDNVTLISVQSSKGSEIFQQAWEHDALIQAAAGNIVVVGAPSWLVFVTGQLRATAPDWFDTNRLFMSGQAELLLATRRGMSPRARRDPAATCGYVARAGLEIIKAVEASR